MEPFNTNISLAFPFSLALKQDLFHLITMMSLSSKGSPKNCSSTNYTRNFIECCGLYNHNHYLCWCSISSLEHFPIEMDCRTSLLFFFFAIVTFVSSFLLSNCYRTLDNVTRKRNYPYMDVVRVYLGSSLSLYNHSSLKFRIWFQ